MKPKKIPPLSDIQVILTEDAGKGKKKHRILTRDEIMALTPDKPKNEIFSELKKKSKKLEEKINQTKNGVER